MPTVELLFHSLHLILSYLISFFFFLLVNTRQLFFSSQHPYTVITVFYVDNIHNTNLSLSKWTAISLDGSGALIL